MFHFFSRRPHQLWLGVTSAFLLAALAPAAIHTRAVQAETGTPQFVSPPRLVNFLSLRNRTNDKRPVYYITVDLSSEAQAPLETLEVTLTQGRFRRLNYRLDKIEVFQGDRGNRGERFPVAAAEYDEDKQALRIELATPAAPGQLITFAIRPTRNPSRAGVYLFEVTASPEENATRLQRIGTGRLSIFDEVDP